jgi:hypothetical protein
LAKIELSKALFCKNAVGFYPQSAGKISAAVLKITQFQVTNAVAPASGAKTSVQTEANDAFEMGTKVKDSLRAKLSPQQ